MLVKAFPSGPYATNAYVAACEETGDAVIIDPAPKSAPAIDAYLKEHRLTCRAIFLTHSHWDHIADIAPLRQIHSLPVYVHALDAPNLRQPGVDQLPLRVDIPPVEPDFLLQGEETLPIGHLNFSVIHTPGHSPGGVCFYEPQQGILFSGDTLFKGTIGNLSFPTCEPDKMWPSLEKLANLPPTTIVYPGHGAATTLQQENWLSRAKEIFGY